MDSFIKLGQQAYQQYSDNQSHAQGAGGPNANTMGGAHLNLPAGGGGQMIDSDGDGIPDLDQAAAHASGHSGDSGDASLFSTAASFLKSQYTKSDDDDDIDEHRAKEAHDRAYNQNQGGSLDAKSMGAAAALQAFKQFQQGGAAGSNGHNNQKDGQSKLLGMAMAQAAKLFDSSGGAASGGQKQDAVNSAGKMVMKLIMKQKLQSVGGGGGGLASMIGKFA